MTIHIDQIESLLTSRGYTCIHETTKKRGYQLSGGLPVYLNLNSKTGQTALIAHPQSGIDALRDTRPDLRIDAEYYHSSNMRQFPQRKHGGKNPICYGWGVTFESPQAVEACLDYLQGKTVSKEELPYDTATMTPPDEEGEAAAGADLPMMASRRIGHDLFRKALMEYWGKCAVSDLKAERLLRASHIKPWASASPEEKTDPYNGLLLAPHIDAAFDAGLITFDSNGALVLSSRLDPEDAAALGLHEGLRLRQLDARHQPYLAFHRQEVFVR